MKIERINSADTFDIRHKVLWPNKHKDFSKLEDDHEGLHYGGYLNGQLICVASIFINGNNARLRKFATIHEFQNIGYGTKMLKFIINDLRESEMKRFWCDARKSAENFYARVGMKRKGDIFYKSDVEYIVMQMDIKPIP